MPMPDLAEFYSPTGTELIETFYSSGYLSMGGSASTDILAAGAVITAETRVLDVGSGLGGPALHIAECHGCRVADLDIVASNIRTAGERALAGGLQHLVEFRLGDATAMPFKAGDFDVILGQDAWCHIPDKDRLIAECARVITPGGRVAFTDWLQRGEMAGAYRDEVLTAMAASNLGTLESYGALLARHGFTVLHAEDVSAVFIAQYTAIVARLEGLESEISETYSPKLYNIIHAMNGTIQRAFADGKLGGGRIIARKDG
jgi:ubiquinone/menaquinone biosynthesis C-methylase UbiE